MIIEKWWQQILLSLVILHSLTLQKCSFVFKKDSKNGSLLLEVRRQFFVQTDFYVFFSSCNQKVWNFEMKLI
jgi:hypothetical protein